MLVLIVDEALDLQRDMALIVIHYDDDVIPPSECFAEHSIGRSGLLVGDVDSFLECLVDGRLDFVDFLAPEHSIFTAMWVESCHADFGIVDAECLAGFVAQTNAVEYALFLHTVASLAE